MLNAMSNPAMVPDPEPDWEPAIGRRPDKRNPVQQRLIEQVKSGHREIAVLTPAIGDVARRLRLHLVSVAFEHGGPAHMAYFEIRQIRFGVYCVLSRGDTIVGLHDEETADLLTAMDVLLEALGIGWNAVAGLATGPRGRMIAPELDQHGRPIATTTSN